MEESRKKVITSLETKLGARREKRNEYKEAIQKKYKFRIDEQERIRHSSQLAPDHGCFTYIVIWIGLLSLMVAFFIYFEIEIPALIGVIGFWASFIIVSALFPKITDSFHKMRYRRSGRKIELLQQKRNAEKAKVEEEYNNDPEVIRLERDLESLR